MPQEVGRDGARLLRMKRSLYLWHRYLGIGLSLAFALWFASGVVMLYAQFPILTPAERLAGLPALDPARFSVTPAAAVAAAGLTGAAPAHAHGHAARQADLLHPPRRSAVAGRVRR